ncbi:hydrogen peroxide-inducible genes activator [uncultured Cohaesibacter sp.]|uniref:hydrogen peroxide-inducible genes activator n=1 Tax=uncultured Cohaesibacter sp. TaxID=1002546 RepID=UPI0029C88DA9|nr:hydrogen peroxide-inducible genes activator [uncultured Cohaesibacter sp.]
MNIRPTLRQLQYLSALAEKQSFREAARACLVSQSTLSAGIRQLEEILQVTLVDRESDHFRLTVMGLEILERARCLLRDADDLVAVARRHDKPLAGRLRLGVIPSIGPFLLPRALPGLRKDFPELKLYLREALSRQLLDDVRAGRLDAAVLALPYPIEDFACQSLGNDGFQVALPLDHPLAVKDAISSEILLKEALILLEDGHCIRDHILSCLDRNNRSKRGLEGGVEHIEATSLITIVQMVANGLGVTLLPRIALQTGLVEGLDIAIRPLVEQPAERELAIIWRKKSAFEPNIRLLAGHLSDFV